MNLREKPEITPATVKMRLAHMTLKQAGAIMGISHARAQQIEAAALKKLARHPLIRQMAVDAGVIAEA